MIHGNYAFMAGFNAGRNIEAMQNRIVERFDADGSGDLSREEVADRRRLSDNFGRIDSNDDGLISGEELGDRLTERMFNHFDRWGGFMGMARMGGYGAMMQMYPPEPEPSGEDAAVAEFNRIDTDGDGVLADTAIAADIAAQEAEAAAAALRQTKIDEVGRMDLDGDGRLSAEELQAELDARAEASAVAQFDGLDSDGDGILSDAELNAGIAAQTEAEAIVESATAVADATLGAPQTPAEDTPAQAQSDDALSLIENVFGELLEDTGQDVSPDTLAYMTQALYAEAQEMLIDQLEAAAQNASEAYAEDDSEAA